MPAWCLCDACFRCLIGWCAHRECLLVLEAGGEDLYDPLGMGSESNGRPQHVSNYKARDEAEGIRSQKQ